MDVKIDKAHPFLEQLTRQRRQLIALHVVVGFENVPVDLVDRP